MRLFSLFFASLACSVLRLTAQEVPHISHFSQLDYRAQNQNWDITQRSDLQLCFGNSGGLLKFDGERWKRFPAPSGQIIRAVACGKDDRIFVGGYSTVGYWSSGDSGKFEYTSLLDSVAGDGFGNEEIWHILPLGDRVIFQSFSKLYFYDYQSVRLVSPPGNCMFARLVNDKIIIPVIDGGLYELTENGDFRYFPGSELFKETRVATVLSHPEAEMMICTQSHGVFIKNRHGFTPWNTAVNEVLKATQLNKAVRLSNGNYVFGTILSGIFLTDIHGEILLHINQENGLQNNTVLSLFEGQSGELWVGLDKGIDLVLPDSPLKYFEDKTGRIGSIYTACMFDQKLFIGSNHGIYFKNYPTKNSDHFQLIDESQGQVWDLQVFDNQLIAGLNFGSASISPDQQKILYDGTGVFTSSAHPTNTGVLLQGTYTGIIVLRKNDTGAWQFSNEIAGFHASTRKIFFDDTGKIWALHPRKGLFRLSLDPNLRQAVQVDSFGADDGLPSEFRMDLVKINDEILVKSDSLFFSWDENAKRFEQKNKIGNIRIDQGEFTLAAGRQGEWFRISPGVTHYYYGEKNTKLRIDLIPGHEKIVSLADSSYLFCMEDGYAILPSRQPGPQIERAVPPIVTEILSNGGVSVLDDPVKTSQPFIFESFENQLRFFFSCPEFSFRPAVRFRLLGFDEKWSAFQNTFSKEYTNLPPGNYEFQVQAETSDEIARFAFRIEPPWHQTPWAFAGYALMTLVALWLSLQWHSRRMRSQERRLQLEKERELQQQRIKAKNEMLQAEIQNKSRKLADTTINLIRKNEILQKIRDELGHVKHKKDMESPARLISQMEHLIDYHLTSEEDWKVFESNFNQLHDQFFKRLKEKFPELTPGDMRLAAYLKMNLSSKEIAPLLNISLRGVENKRYRLRKKMGLEADDNLIEFFMQF